MKIQYDIITEGHDIDYRLYRVYDVSAKLAIVTFCEYCGLSDIKLKALKALELEDTIKLANEWLCDKILYVTKVENILYDALLHEYVDINTEEK